MKKIISLLVLSAAAFGVQTPIYVIPPATGYTQAPAAKKSTPPTDAASAELAAITKTHKDDTKSKGISEVMIISPELRAKDLQAAIKFLNLHVPTAKPNITLSDGSKITSIMDVEIMPGGTILIFKITSLKGLQYKVVNIEEVQSLSE